MNKITWTRKKGTGANFKVGDRVKQLIYYGTITAVDKDFQKNIDIGCPFYYVKVKFDNYPHRNIIALTSTFNKKFSKKFNNSKEE